jgi:hypothetical protein
VYEEHEELDYHGPYLGQNPAQWGGRASERGAFYLKSFRNSARATVRLAFDDADPTIANNLLVGLMLNETRRG